MAEENFGVVVHQTQPDLLQPAVPPQKIAWQAIFGYKKDCRFKGNIKSDKHNLVAVPVKTAGYGSEALALTAFHLQM